MRDSASVRDSGAGGVAVWMWRSRRSAALAGGLGFVVGCMAGSLPASAQVRPGPTPDPIDHLRALLIQPVLKVPVPVQPAERLVAESRQRDTGTGQDRDSAALRAAHHRPALGVASAHRIRGAGRGPVLIPAK
jgi:hypothetical protein